MEAAEVTETVVGREISSDGREGQEQGDYNMNLRWEVKEA